MISIIGLVFTAGVIIAIVIYVLIMHDIDRIGDDVNDQTKKIQDALQPLADAERAIGKDKWDAFFDALEDE
jgi:hypothetical protein